MLFLYPIILHYIYVDLLVFLLRNKLWPLIDPSSLILTNQLDSMDTKFEPYQPKIYFLNPKISVSHYWGLELNNIGSWCNMILHVKVNQNEWDLEFYVLP
jgi:hypothetical protein